MYNNWLTIGPITIHGYGVMIAIGILVAVWLAEKLAKQHGLDGSKIEGIAISGVISGFFFSKVTYILTVFPQFLKDPAAVLGTSGWVVYGGILGGILGAGLYCRAKHLAFMKYFNVVMPTVALAQAFGRIGCFFAGCCYGVETHSHFALTFPGGSLAPAGVPLVPTQLLSSFGDFVLFVILYQALKNPKTENRVAALYLILYSIGRFLIEFVRGDIIRGKIGILSTSQFIAIWVLLAGIILYIYLGKKEKKA